MKDLYLKLGIAHDAQPEDIEAAIKNKPEMAETASILLNDRRRAAYNRSLSTIRSIGVLRHRLGLDKEPTWFQETCPDFAPNMHIAKFTSKPTPAGHAAKPVAPQPVSEQRKQAGAKSKFQWLQPVYIGLALIVLLALVVYLI